MIKEGANRKRAVERTLLEEPSQNICKRNNQTSNAFLRFPTQTFFNVNDQYYECKKQQCFTKQRYLVDEQIGKKKKHSQNNNALHNWTTHTTKQLHSSSSTSTNGR